MQSLTQNLSFFSPLLSRSSKSPEPTKIQMKSTNGYSKNPIFFTSHHKCILHSPDKPFSRKGFSKKPIFFTSQKCIHRHYSDILPFSAKGFSKNPIFFTSLKCIHSPDEPISSNSKNSSVVCCFTTLHETPVQPLTVAEKVHCLACEFKSLSEPIDRVKKLLHYAALLPPFDQSGRVEENRVMGCTTMVWLEVEMDSASRLMRFKLDSDSEITKGFCACLLWLLDGAVPEEVLNVKIDDLAEMNVGMPSKGHSRVNTWHNILISMQKKTTNFVEVQDRDRPLT